MEILFDFMSILLNREFKESDGSFFTSKIDSGISFTTLAYDRWF